MDRIPRKKKKQIPSNTPYCYTRLSGMMYPEGEVPYYKVKPCPYYVGLEGIEGRCKLVGCEVDDQVKSCGISMGFGD